MNGSKRRRLGDVHLRQLIAEHGFRVTEQRMLLLRELANSRAPASHAELSERLAGTALDRVTIYRNLLSLTQVGMLVRTQLGDNVWRFELPLTRGSRHGQHPHFICTDCGHIACLPAGNVQLQGEAARNEVSEVQLRGRCASCVAASGARDASGRHSRAAAPSSSRRS